MTLVNKITNTFVCNKCACTGEIAFIIEYNTMLLLNSTLP